MGNPIIVTREEFEAMYGEPCPDWMWEMLMRNYADLKAKGKTNG